MTMTLDQKARPRRHNGAIIRPSPSALDAIAIATKAFPGICPEGLTWGLSGPRAYEEHPWCGDEIDLCTGLFIDLYKNQDARLFILLLEARRRRQPW